MLETPQTRFPCLIRFVCVMNKTYLVTDVCRIDSEIGDDYVSTTGDLHMTIGGRRCF